MKLKIHWGTCLTLLCLAAYGHAMQLFIDNPIPHNPYATVETNRVRPHRFETLVYDSRCPHQIIWRRLAFNEYYAGVIHNDTVNWSYYYFGPFESNECEPEAFQVYNITEQPEKEELR
jgi:hypothetical protein